uniref:RNA-dependent RNA polymerase n=1 Tax=Botryosphaeria dothidea TaxID=55169 RepID=A0A8F9WMC3_9PEZI|nr:RNA-dependent RNA polymerase [Botryosphaeria dothidea]
MTSTTTKGRRACACAVRAVKALNLATEIFAKEGLVDSRFDCALIVDCEGLMGRWKEWCEAKLSRKKGVPYWRLSLAIKGCKTIFDEPCKTCDPRRADAAREEWARRAFAPGFVTRQEVICDIKSRVRQIMGRKWWSSWEGKGKARVPDQQGCYELKRLCGGTLSVPRWYENPINASWGETTIKERREVNLCRVGTAKTKGKLRVVTMQGARVKRLLRPVHEAAYDWLTQFDWLVRGEVTPDHFLSVVCDEDPDDSFFISGDFVASTDNLHLDAVLAVVDVLCEALPEKEKSVLKASFDGIKVDWKGGVQVVSRGSMMGNLVSFVVLCLLNKVSVDRAVQDVYNVGPCHRKVLINGDDCLFRGNDRLYARWLETTADVGFVVNQEKTMKSTRYLELNSNVFDSKRGRMIDKMVFGFLSTESWKLPAESMTSEIFRLVRFLRRDTARWFLTTLPVRNAFRRVRPPVTSVPRSWRSFLLKKWWFRSCVLVSEPVETMTGSERKLDFCYGPPLAEPDDFKERAIRELDTVQTVSQAWEWRGKLCCPPHRTKKMRFPKAPKRIYKKMVLRAGPVLPRRLWLMQTLELVKEFLPHWLAWCPPVGTVVDQHGLVMTREWRAYPHHHQKPVLVGEWVPYYDGFAIGLRPN